MTTIPWSEAAVDKSGREGSTEWNYFLREVGRLLAEGHEGKWVLLQGEAIVGMCDTRDEAFAAASERHRRGETCLAQQVTARAPVIRLPYRLWHLWPS